MKLINLHEKLNRSDPEDNHRFTAVYTVAGDIDEVFNRITNLRRDLQGDGKNSDLLNDPVYRTPLATISIRLDEAARTLIKRLKSYPCDDQEADKYRVECINRLTKILQINQGGIDSIDQIDGLIDDTFAVSKYMEALLDATVW